MNDKLIESIQLHLSLLDLAVSCSQNIRDFAAAENLDAVVSETDNRERIVNIVSQVQSGIEGHVNLLSPEDLTNEGINILKSWFNDLNICSEKMLSFDRETVEFLAQQKEDTTKEIAHIFKNKEMFKGYSSIGKK